MHVASYVWDWGAHPPTQGQGWVLEAKALTDLLTPSIPYSRTNTFLYKVFLAPLTLRHY